MNRVLLAITLMITACLSSQAKRLEFPLWPDSTADRNEVPVLYVYPAQKPNGTAIVMCPGGGYHKLAMDHEGRDMAKWFNSLGITYAVLKYTLPLGNHTLPLADAEQAMRIMRSHAEEWGIRPNSLGIMGASAGGHLASTLATHYTSPLTRPDFQILFYPVITMEEGLTHKGSRDNLLGTEPTPALVTLFSNELQVTGETPKAFIMASTDDRTVPVENSLRYYTALIRNGVGASMHLYPTGGHGWGYNDSFIYKRDWTGELEKWLRTEIIAPQ